MLGGMLPPLSLSRPEAVRTAELRLIKTEARVRSEGTSGEDCLPPSLGGADRLHRVITSEVNTGLLKALTNKQKSEVGVK